MKLVCALFFLILFSSLCFAGEGYWLRGKNFTNFIEGKQSNFMSANPPNLSSEQTTFSPGSDGVLGQWYTSTFPSTLQVHTQIVIWHNGLSTPGGNATWELYDFDPLKENSNLLVSGEIDDSKEEFEIALEEPFTIDSGHRLKLLVRAAASASLVLDGKNLSAKSEWTAPDGQEFLAPGINKTMILYIETCSFSNIACNSDLSCNDSNPYTQDICISPGTCQAKCDHGSCNPSCTSSIDCNDSNPFTIDRCNGAGSCTAFCTNVACSVECNSQTECDDSNPNTTDTCTYPGTCFSSCENVPAIEKTIRQEGCRLFECTQNSCTEKIALNCCANELCEQGETCSEDCGATPMIVLAPMKGDYVVRGETFTLSVIAAKNSTLSANGFFGKQELFDDGKHSDGAPNDGVYSNSFSISTGQEEGVKTIAVENTDTGQSIFLHLNIIPVLDLTVETNKNEFVVSDVLEISGNVSRKGTPVTGPVTVNARNSGKIIFTQTINSDAQGSFYHYYKSISSDPTGEWEISASIDDEFDNRGSKTLLVDFFEPEQALPIKVKLLSILKPEYEPGETVNLDFLITEDGEAIEGAKITAEVSGQRIDLVPMGNGLFSLRVRIPTDAPLGIFTLPVRAEAQGDLGQKIVEFPIAPRTILIELINPDKNDFMVGELVPVEFKLTYKDGEPITDADARVLLDGEESKIEKRDGLYHSNVKIGSENNFILTIEASTITGAYGYSDFSGNTSGYSFNYYLDTYSSILIPALIILLLLGLWFGHMAFSKMSMENLDSKETELLKQIKYIQTRYFKLGALSRKKYDELMLKYEQQLQEIRQKRNKGSKGEES